MYRLQVKKHFDAAHYLKDYVGKCSREHGHRWEVEVCLQGEELGPRNMLVDFGIVKQILDYFLDKYLDHHQLNDTLGEPNPTAEFLAKWLFDHVEEWARKTFVANGRAYIHLVRVCIWESPECCIKYSPDLRSVGG